ncbi:hypothetical protein ENSA7_77210 [Enhygromyxa salina]|uniref:Uncharacterized protein n=2 Tax=Enhygromyxa salina TaxID=215803 RepID=A0A2S9XPV7_9BACT|nr:hypothetical protein ENSA7_77210 [Enhygromyxa salina]
MLLTQKTLPKTLYWSAPLDLDSDFTPEDPLAFDYLGQQVGLWLFEGFTTRTSRAQNYAVVIYGLHLAELACQRYDIPSDDVSRTKLFERWERFWALATLESHGRSLGRGHADGMRGIRGATRAWFDGARPLRLDYSLISRQSELGSLGAYLSSLRTYKLVVPGTLRPSLAARTIIDAFWDEPDQNQAVGQYQEYALRALDPKRLTIERKHGRISLAKVGKMSRLSSLTERGRKAQQDRLWQALFLNARDGTTLSLAHQLIAARRDGVDASAELLEGMLEGRWGPLDPPLRDLVQTAIAFGRFAQLVLDRFASAYAFINDHNWVADFAATASAAFPAAQMDELRAACREVLDAPASARFRRLVFHGPPMMQLVVELSVADSSTALDRLLAFHRAVQQSRRGGGSWIRRQDDKLILQATNYTGYRTRAQFPEFKLGVVQRLLHDLGRLS